MLNPNIIAPELDFSGNKTIRETIYVAIKQAILDGKLSVGERIVEKTFAEAFRVSRTPVREALRRLETEGHVEYIPRTGVVVSSITKEDVIEVYKIRKALEALVLEQVIENVTSEGCLKLSMQISESKEFALRGEIDDLVKNYQTFNSLLMDIADLPRLRIVLSQITEYVLRFRKISAEKVERRMKAINEHELILKAIQHGDLKEAVRINDDHLDSALELILTELFNDDE